MTIDPPHPAPAGRNRLGAGFGQVVRWRLRPVAAAEQMRILTIGGRAMRVAVREGDPGRPPLLLCNGIGASLEVFQPFVDALDPRRPVIRFDMPGIGGSPAPVVPYHLGTSARLLAGQPVKRRAAIAKLTASDAAMANARDATQIFGGYGFMNEFPVARFYRDAKVLEIGEGTSEVQRMIIARELGLDG